MGFQKGHTYGHRFKPGEVANPNGRPKKVSNVVKAIPKDAQEKLYGVLYHAVSLNNIAEAKEYLIQENAQSMGKYGIVLEIVINALTGKDGWATLCDIFAMLFGRPRQQSEVVLDGNIDYTFKFGGEQ